MPNAREQLGVLHGQRPAEASTAEQRAGARDQHVADMAAGLERIRRFVAQLGPEPTPPPPPLTLADLPPGFGHHVRPYEAPAFHARGEGAGSGVRVGERLLEREEIGLTRPAARFELTAVSPEDLRDALAAIKAWMAKT
jgi:hypothetical protein